MDGISMSTDKKPKQTEGREPNGYFAVGNKLGPGRPSGASCRALRMARDAAEKVALPRLIDAAEGGDMDAIRTLLSFGLPRQRPVSVPEPVALPDNASLTEQAQALIRLVAAGEVSAAAANEIAGILSVAARVDEMTELREQVADLKRVLDSRKEGERK